MLRRKEAFTTATPIPGYIPRQLAIDILHSHSEIITLNPLVLHHKPIPPPRDAPSDEYYCTWYEITESIQYIPGIGKMGAGTIKFRGCFHDMPWGLQTHIYAPLNVDLRNTYRVAGNRPGAESPRQEEIGLGDIGLPADGLYLREDIEIKCNVAVVGFVKAQLQKATKEMVSRIIKKAELLDAGILHAMIEDGRLRTINPADRSSVSNPPLSPPSSSPTGLFPIQKSPGSHHESLKVTSPYFSQSHPYRVFQSIGAQAASPKHGQTSELPSSSHQTVAELPGDYGPPRTVTRSPS